MEKTRRKAGTDEQRRRFLSRIDTPAKNWKIGPADIAERTRWSEYMDAYQDAIAATASKRAPWFIVPANSKPFARLVVVEAMVAALASLKLTAPEVSAQDRDWLASARQHLQQEG